jgi:hypothetical protein
MNEISRDDVKELVKDWPVPMWLLNSLESDDPTTLVGMVGRLADAEVEDSAEAVRLRMDGHPGPAARARALCRKLSDSVLDSIRSELDFACETLCDDIESLTESAPTPYGASIALSIRLRRDRIESLAWILRNSGRQRMRDWRLEVVDRTAHAHSFTIVDAGYPEDGFPRHLSAVGWQEPNNWWGNRPGDMQ